MARQTRTPITILTGFAGAGKTTIILNLLPQLRTRTPGYKLGMIKNEIGDLNVDTQLAAAAEMAGTQELLGDCICCTNIGQIETTLETLRESCNPDRVVIETSGSAEPLKLVLEVNRIAAATGAWELDGVVSVIDAENWTGYANTSYTAKLQASQTDLIVINKWEGMGEREYDVFLDRLGDLDVDTPQVKSDKGWVSVDLLFGLDGKMARGWAEKSDGCERCEGGHSGAHDHSHGRKSTDDHKSEIECISVSLISTVAGAGVDLKKLDGLLKTAPKDEVFRIKAVVYSSETPEHSNGEQIDGVEARQRWILNWSFGRWTWSGDDVLEPKAPALRMSVFTAQYESTKWMKRIESGNFIALSEPASAAGHLEVKRTQ
ncbi:hypothetical protein LTR09_010179 [Extremus antarcticus]|uniref:CobW/HypB/UreG nucleotide-binding domain-containing protein n=1 Tax=Extremus antarcticus TaxID=702011 RepID=A0AAJ0DED4_9PEZI|nr:hypothetical protein LTR09_010179 [Extremus antarcticus]